jgi:hypothetical protein
MIAFIARWMARLRARPRLNIEVVGAHPLSSGLAVYVIDVEGRRTVLAAGSHAMCVLSSYQVPKRGGPEGPQAAIVKS